MNDNIKETYFATCVIADDEGRQCGEPGWLNRMLGLPVVTCRSHYNQAYAAREQIAENTVHMLQKDGALDKHTEGWTYVVGLSDGTVKIGMTKSSPERRLQEVSKKYNDGTPVEVLAILKGGRSKELEVHGKWRLIRVTTMNGERFEKTPELVQWINNQGIHEEAKEAVRKYEQRSMANGGT